MTTIDLGELNTSEAAAGLGAQSGGRSKAMITILSYDWKEQPTLEMLNEALKPHGLKVLSFENGDSFDWVIASTGSTTEQMVDALIQTERFEPDEDESESEFRTSLAGMLKAE